MSIARAILDALAQSPTRRVQVPRVAGAGRAYLAATLIREQRLPVLIARDPEEADGLHRDLAFLIGARPEDAAQRGLILIDGDEHSPYEPYSPDPRAVMDRISGFYRLTQERTSVRAIILTARALARKHVPPELFQRGAEYLIAGESLDRDRLLSALVASGYNAVTAVEDPGTFSVRGGIIDVYSPYWSRPIRIDLFGDEIESLRAFDPTTQRTAEELEDTVILPAREILFDEIATKAALAKIDAMAEEASIPSRKLRAIREDVENKIHFFGIEGLLPLFYPSGLVTLDQYLPRGDDVIFLLGDREPLEAVLVEIEAEAGAHAASARATHELALAPEAHYADGHRVLERALEGAAQIELPEMVVSSKAKDAPPILELSVEPTRGLRTEILKAAKVTSEGDTLEPVVTRLKEWRSRGYVTLLAANTRGQAERLKSLLAPKGLSLRLRTAPVTLADLPGRSAAEDQKSLLADRSVHAFLVLGDVSGGFVAPADRLVLLSEEEIFGQRIKPRRRRAQAPAGGLIADLADLKPGDFVVHIDHGIGKYLGIVRLAVNGVDGDFLHIEYRDGDKLYLPVHRLRLVQKYASAEDGRNPPLSKLGSQTWLGTKRKVKDTLLKMAAELLRLYAARATLEGFAFPPPSEAYTRFEAEFPFEPTPDQQKAIDDVIRDVQKPNPMDRLICGDVGYGKTEVAMRGAMLAFLAKKQVAVLVPTTVLATQHHQVFSERFANFEARIGIVSRFQSNEDIKRTLDDLKAGRLDIIIGTHRLLSKDVEFKDLGLLVIDEEHRFGVKHKEQLKKYRTRVHVLTMSATPIPRTMHLGMMGVRDLSMIATPPVDRLAVKTEVHKFSEDVIRDAVLQEIRRGGQCFVVHNRVASIDAFGRMLGKLVPEARTVIGHGQMAEDQLEKVMVDFMSKQYNVLLSTTIIESGIDIASANTIIVNRADRMGLAQLYQLRGRVGRSRVRGYAHFLIPAGNLTKDARKRIAVLQRFTELGAGFKVATHDLEIRGAGNILGKEQSGTMSAVGFEMYQALLAEAIEELKGQGHRALKEQEIQVPVPALIPDSYVPPPSERLAYYQRFNRAETDEVTFDLLQEIADLYGTPPAEVENLTSLMLVKQRLARLGAVSLDFGAETKSMPPRVVIRFDPEEVKLTPAQLVSYVERGAGRRKLLPDGRLMVSLAPFEDPREILQQSKDLLDALLLHALKAA
ncbi:MAG: transcription-repair coupling factor [Deltaproteobacteria bacterium]|nr:transcription-repair coupling factor [Deltaproteobacteria bacterium]